MEKKANNAFKHLIVIGFSVIALTAIVQVIARYFFNNPIMWAEELARYAFIWCVMIAAGIGLSEGAHLSLNLISDKTNISIKIALLFIRNIIQIIFMFVIIIYSYKLVIHNTNILSPALKIPMAFPYAGILIGGCVILFNNILVLRKELKTIISK